MIGRLCTIRKSTERKAVELRKRKSMKAQTTLHMEFRSGQYLMNYQRLGE